MSDSVKSSLWKLLKTVGSAVIVFVTSLVANWIGADGTTVAVVGGSIAGSLMC